MDKNIIKVSYPKVVLLEQLRPSNPINERYLNRCWIHVFQASKEFGGMIYEDKSEDHVADPVFCSANIRVGNRVICHIN